MANILEQYGIKEVADVTFYHINKDTGSPDYPVLYLDTLKVSTIEQTAEEATANGGKGNPPLISWDYGKDITVTLEDALFSAKSMAMMFGNGDVAEPTATNFQLVRTFVATAASAAGIPAEISAVMTDATSTSYYEAGTTNAVTVSEITKDKAYFVVYGKSVTSGTYVIDINPSTFPGTYYVTGDTYARSNVSGDDEYFQFIIPKAKITSEKTLTMEADGDPSVFNLDLHVLRPGHGKPMMQLIKYGIKPTAQA